MTHDNDHHATRILRDDHRRIKGLFRQFEAIGRRAREMEPGVASEIFMELEIHSSLEERIFYPALIEAVRRNPAGPTGTPLDPTLIDSSIQDHREIRQMIRALRGQAVDTGRFAELMDDLIQTAEAHITQEETELLPQADLLLLGGQLPLAGQMRELRVKLLGQPEYAFALPEVVQDPHGGEQMRKRTG